MKRELSRHEDSRVALETKFQALESAQRERWERHNEKHSEESRRLDSKREHANEAIQKVRTELLEHCAESSERYLTKDEFVSSTTYLTKKTDEVSRLLQSIENVLMRR
jgi:uncharacterized coiled-coil DUF342 family protein